MTLIEVIQERMKDGKWKKREKTSSLDSSQICLALNRVCTTLARASKRKTWLIRRKEERCKMESCGDLVEEPGRFEPFY